MRIVIFLISLALLSSCVVSKKKYDDLLAQKVRVDADLAERDTKDPVFEIPKFQIGKSGFLQEWIEDRDDPTNKHRHVSHLWGVFPGEEITPANPNLFHAARQSRVGHQGL